MFSWSLFPSKLIRWSASVHYRVTERVQQMRFLPCSCPLNSLFPIRQYLFHISFRALQRFKVCFDTFELFLRKLVNAVAGSASCIANFQNLSQLCQSEADPKGLLHNKHSLQRTCGIKSISRFRARCPLENANPLVVSNRIWTHPGHL